MAEPAYGFSKEHHGRVSRATHAVEGMIRGGGIPARGSVNTPYNRGCIPALTTGTISALSGSTAGSGNATLYLVSNSGVLSTGEAITVWNLASGTEGAVASAKKIFVSFGAGKWWLIWVQEDCS